jgi:hypothetical protein
LFSFDARGSIADALTYSNWKGVATVRQRVVPANPDTTAQKTQRAIITAANNWWKIYITSTLVKNGWDKLAQIAFRSVSGWNMFVRNFVPLFDDGADLAYNGSMTLTSAAVLKFNMLEVKDGSSTAEAGNFLIKYGLNPRQLDQQASVALAASSLTLDAHLIASSGDTVYGQVTKQIGGVGDVLYRSGIVTMLVP